MHQSLLLFLVAISISKAQKGSISSHSLVELLTTLIPNSIPKPLITCRIVFCFPTQLQVSGNEICKTSAKFPLKAFALSVPLLSVLVPRKFHPFNVEIIHIHCLHLRRRADTGAENLHWYMVLVFPSGETVCHFLPLVVL